MKAMMKTIVAMAVMVMAFCTGAVTNSAWAAGGGGTVITPTWPASLPIGSHLALMSYAKGAVAGASAYGGSGAIMLPDGRSWAQVATNHPDIRVIEKLLAKETLTFHIVDTEATYFFYGDLYDDAGHELFWGSSQFKLVDMKGPGWSVPTNATKVEVTMVSWAIPIHIPGVQSAYAVVTEADGNRYYVGLRVEGDGYVFFPPSLTGLATQGWSGQMVLMGGGSSAVYDMPTGDNQPTVVFDAAVQSSIKGLVTLDDPAQIISTPATVNGQGTNPLYQVAVTSSKSIKLYGMTSEGQIAKGVWVRQVGMPAVYYPITLGTSLSLPFSAGVWDVWFEYPDAFPETPSIPPYNDGGLG